MKKLIAIVMVLAILLSCAGCEKLFFSGIWTYIALDGWGNSSASEISDSQNSTDEEEQNQTPALPEITKTEAEQFILDHHAQFSHRCLYMTPEEVANQSVINETFGEAYGGDGMSVWSFGNYAWREATAAEKNEVKGLLKGELKNEGGYATIIAETEDVQQFYDSIWGKGRVDVSRFDDIEESLGYEYQQLSGGKIAHCHMGYGAGCVTNIVYKITGGEYVREHNAYIVRVKALYCMASGTPELYPHEIRFISNWRDPVQSPIMWEGSGSAVFVDFDEVLDYTGIRERNVDTTDIVLYMTEDGVRLWGVGPSGTVCMPPKI